MTDKVCRIIFLQAGQEIGESTFTIEDAKRAGTKNIDKFPRNMLFARALSNGVRWFTPDVVDATVYTPDELRAGDDDAPMRPAAPPADPATGEVIDAPAPVAARMPRGEGGAAAPARDLSEAQGLVAEIRQLGGDPGAVTPRKLREMSDAEYRNYIDGMRETRDALISLQGTPESEQIAA